MKKCSVYQSGYRRCLKSNKILCSALMKVKPGACQDDTKGVIHCVPCCDCDKSYIGETRRALAVRLAEHKQYCHNREINQSGMSQYTLQNDHGIHWEGSTVLGKEPNYYRRRVKEALYIMKFKNMSQHEDLAVSPLWNIHVRLCKCLH